MSSKNSDHYFLRGGGEMGEMTRAKDWSKTSLGDSGKWPQSLRTTLGILLNTKFPMFLWWGNELICFYNDAYRPSLGKDGKHPSILGMPAKEAWPEIWDIIKPLIDKVMNEEGSIWFEDMLVPIYRNGKIEDVYWTFSYSPVPGDNGKVAGVLVTCTETTEKVNTLRKIEESNVRYINNIMQAPVAMCIFRGENFVVEIANEEMLSIWGREARQVMNKPIFEGLPEAKDQGLEALLLNVYKTGEKFVANERPVKLPRNGKVEITYVNFVYDALKEVDGTISGIVAIAIEVTPQVIARSKVEESEQKVRALVENVPFPIAVYVGKEMIVELANQSIIDIWGKGNDVIGRSFKEVLPELDNQLVFEQIEKVLTTGESFHTKNTALDLIVDGKSRTYYFNYSFTPLYDLAGNIYGVMNTGVDLTDLNVARKKIEESEKRFRSLAESLPQLIWETDEKGDRLYASGRWKEYTGLTPAGEAEWKAIIHPDDLEVNAKTWINSLATGDLYRDDVRIKSKHGDYRWHSVIGEPVFDKENRIVKWVGAFTDIHTEKAFTQELEKQVAERTKELGDTNMELEKMNKELQTFAYISSHDLQEPLRKIQTFSSQIIEKESQNLSESGKDKFRRMQNAAYRMQTLIDDLLTYSRTNSNERKFEKTDLATIIDEVKEDLKEELQQKHATVEVDEMCEANIIPFQFRQLLFNLLNNSLKFSNPGEFPHIKIKSEMAEGVKFNNPKLVKEIKYCHLSISDNGIGFEQQYSEKIFEVFQRLHGKNEYNGTGIGLSIVKRIVENHHGIITAKGELNKGATFDIYIPAT